MLLMGYGKRTTYLRDVAELVDPLDPLQVEATNGTEMSHTGWVEVSFKLTANDEELLIPVLEATSNLVLLLALMSLST